MFSLLVTIVSIALIAALAVATLYYGGTSFTSATDEAAAAQLVIEGQQVKGALTLYNATTGQTPDEISELVSSSYLKQVPPDWVLVDGYAVKAASSENQCLAANRKQGVDLVPTCADYQANPAYAGKTLCCSYAD